MANNKVNNKVIFDKLYFPNRLFISIHPNFNKNPKNNIWNKLAPNRRIGLRAIKEMQRWQKK